MKKILLLLVMPTIFLACDNTQKKVLTLNDKFAGYSKELQKKGFEIGRSLETAITTKNFSDFTTKANALDDYIDSSLVGLSRLENIGGSEKLKSAMKDFLLYEKDLMNELRPFTKFNSMTPDAEISFALENFKRKGLEENRYVNRAKEEQFDFAKRNGFVVEE